MHFNWGNVARYFGGLILFLVALTVAAIAGGWVFVYIGTEFGYGWSPVLVVAGFLVRGAYKAGTKYDGTRYAGTHPMWLWMWYKMTDPVVALHKKICVRVQTPNCAKGLHLWSNHYSECAAYERVCKECGLFQPYGGRKTDNRNETPYLEQV